MTAKDFENFAQNHGIYTVDVEGTFGCGYACAYVYYEPESVVKCVRKLEEVIKDLNKKVKELEKNELD